MRRRAQDGDGDGEQLLDMRRFGGGGADAAASLCASDLVTACVKSGWVEKRRERCLGLCPSCCGPVYRRRFMVLKGAYVYKFGSEHASRPKGTPIAVEAATVERAVLENEPEEPERPLLRISTLRKEWLVRCESEADADAWVVAVRGSRRRVIRERMGHVPMDADDVDANAAGQKLVERSLRQERADAEGIQMQLMGREMGTDLSGM